MLCFCLLYAISQVMESSDDDPAYVVKFKSTFRKDLETRKENANIAYLKIATALDPRFKELKCIPRAERAEVWASVTYSRNRGLLQRNLWKQQHQSHQRESLAYWLLHQSLILNTRKTQLRTVCVDIQRAVRYSGGPNTDRTSSIAEKYLSTPATSVPCERLFSLAGHIVQKKRVSLSSENVNDLVCNWFGKCIVGGMDKCS